jgi:hypothetical protein
LLARLLNWEFWPFGIIQAPLFAMWLGYALRERSLFYFSASNPGIYTGGMMGESKFEVLQLLPPGVRPKSLLIRAGSPPAQLREAVSQAGFTFPFVVKPDLGERGWMVRHIHNFEELEAYRQQAAQIPVDFIVQERIDLPLEFGVFYQRHPARENGRVTSVTGKKFLAVTGDGRQPLRSLIMASARARLQWKTLQHRFRHRLDEVLPPGEQLELEPVGNHCLGTEFTNANHLINPRLNAAFDRLSKQIPGFYFGRYDLRCASVDDLENGRVMILELNGCGAEPAHIYQPGASLWQAIATLMCHWHALYQISAANHRRGAPYLTFGEAWSVYRRMRGLRKQKISS